MLAKNTFWMLSKNIFMLPKISFGCCPKIFLDAAKVFGMLLKMFLDFVQFFGCCLKIFLDATKVFLDAAQKYFWMLPIISVLHCAAVVRECCEVVEAGTKRPHGVGTT